MESILVEEYRGDFAFVRNRIDDSPYETDNLQVQTLLLRAVPNLLIGDIAEAPKTLYQTCDPVGGFAQVW